MVYRYPKDAIITSVPEKDYLDEYRASNYFIENMLEKNYWIFS